MRDTCDHHWGKSGCTICRKTYAQYILETNYVIQFGKYKGEILTRLPQGYLRFIVMEKIRGPIHLPPLNLIAAAELERRGARSDFIEITGHAIDRFSFKYLDRWDRKVGLYTFIEQQCERAIKKNRLSKVQKNGSKVYRHLGISWVIKSDLAIPVLKTVL